MKKIIICSILLSLPVLADQFVPEFDKMQTIKCEISETVYVQDNSVVSTSQYHRIFRFDDDYSKMYIQKEPISNILIYSRDRAEFFEQSMTDDFIIYSNITIDRTNNKYMSESKIIYDNPEFPSRFAKASGDCSILN